MIDALISAFSDSAKLAAAVAAVGLLAGVLSQYLSLVEYYWVKGFDDFFRVPEDARSPMRKGFHPDFLLYAIGIMLVWVLVTEALRKLAGDDVGFWGVQTAIAASAAALGAVAGLLYWVYYKELLEQASGVRGEFAPGCAFTGLYAFLAVLLPATAGNLLFLLETVVLGANDYLSFVSAIAFGALLVPMWFYRWSKMLLPFYFREASVVTIDGDTYAVLATGSAHRFCVKCSADYGRKLELDMGDARLVPAVSDLPIADIVFRNLKVKGAVRPMGGKWLWAKVAELSGCEIVRPAEDGRE